MFALEMFACAARMSAKMFAGKWVFADELPEKRDDSELFKIDLIILDIDHDDNEWNISR